MRKQLIITLIILIILGGLVQAGPQRNITIHVEDYFNNSVQNANVYLYSDPLEYYEFEGLTDENGNISFMVDSRVYIVANNTMPAIRGAGNPFTQSKAEIDPTKDRNIRYQLYRNKTFFFEIEGTGNSIDFGSIYTNDTFKLNQDWNFDFNVTNYFNVSNIPDYTINEADNHQFIYDLNDYIITSEPENVNFTFDYDFSDIDAYFNFDEETWLLTVNFFPELDLSYHVNNEIQIESTITLDDETNEQVFFVDYIPEHKAVIGHVQDHYTREPIYNSTINSYTSIADLMFINNYQTFLGFYVYGSDGDSLSIEKDNYITSERFVRTANVDQDLNFTLIPEIFNQSTLHDDLFTQLFRWDDDATVRESEYPEDLMTYSICTVGFDGYNVSETELSRTNFSLNQIAEFTNNYHQPFQGYINFIDNQTDCLALQGQMGYALVLWNASLESDESTIEYLYWGNKIHGVTVEFGGNTQSIITQKLVQAISTPNLQNNLTESVFSGMGLDELSPLDVDWGRRLYMRRSNNFAPDTDEDFSAPTRTNYEIKLTTAKYNGEKPEIETKIIGYAKNKEELKNIYSKEQPLKNKNKSNIPEALKVKILMLFK